MGLVKLSFTFGSALIRLSFRAKPIKTAARIPVHPQGRPMSTASTQPEFIYKIATASAYAPARQSGSFSGMPIDATDGYMHFSTAAQLAETLRLHFKGQSDLVLLAVRTADLGTGLVWEPSRGGQMFPHLYGGPLKLSSIAWERPISVSADGDCVLPEDVK